MTIEAIKARVQQLEAQKKQLQANLFAIDGALQDCEYWLAQLQDTGCGIQDAAEPLSLNPES